MKHIRYIAMLLLLAGCTPGEQEYCERMGVPLGAPNYTQCVQFYASQKALYSADRNICELEADNVYPRYLYDDGGVETVYVGGPHGQIVPHNVLVQPDHVRNAMLDQLRRQIVEPCMASRGWRDPYNWEAGKLTPAPARSMKPVAPHQPLPWGR